jgi:hypothetical protein
VSTFLQVLRLAFWGGFPQRVLTCVGVSAIATGIGRPWPIGLSLSVSTMLFSVFFVASAAVLMIGGVYWRMASAPRIVRLAPHGRANLLVSAIGLVLLMGCLWHLMFWLSLQRWFPAAAYLSPTVHLVDTVGLSIMATLAAMGAFIASRSPLAALVVLLVLIAPGASASLIDVRLSRHNTSVSVLLAMFALIWMLFAAWYLRARRVSRPGWLSGGGDDVLATALVSAAGPKSRSEALQRQLLGGTTILRFGAQWLVILGLLLALQWLFASLAQTDPTTSAQVMYASLCICPVVTTMVSFAAIRRSRTLWLLTGSTRGEFYNCVERILVRLNLAMVLVFACGLAALWFAQSWRTGPIIDQVALANVHLMSLWIVGLFAIYAQLARWPKWLVAVLAASTLVIVWWLTVLALRSHTVKSLEVLLGTGLIMTVPVAWIALRWHAQRCWREGDLPRAVTSAASGI